MKHDPSMDRRMPALESVLRDKGGSDPAARPGADQPLTGSERMSSKVPAGFRELTMGGEFIAVNGPFYLFHEGQRVKLGFVVESRHCNPMGICHGGMMASFCDMLLPVSAHRKAPEIAQRFLPTINLQIDYLAAAQQGAWVEGEAQVLRVTRSLVFVQGLVDADGTPVARVSGIFKLGEVFTAPRADREG